MSVRVEKEQVKTASVGVDISSSLSEGSNIHFARTYAGGPLHSECSGVINVDAYTSHCQISRITIIASVTLT